MVFILLFLLNLSLSKTPIQAQQADTNQYRNDVSYQQDVYNQIYNLYLGKKQVHLQYNSISTEKELIDIIKNTLSHRESLLSTYLLLLRSSMDRYKPISVDRTNQLQQQLFDHQVWLKNQSKQISQIQNQNQLGNYNQVFFEKYIQIQTSMATARIQNHINHQQTIIKEIKNLILQLKAEHKLDQQAQSWINQIETNLQTSQLHLNQAGQETQTKQNTRNFKDFYPDGINQINKSKQSLTKTIQDLQSLIKKFS